MNMLTGCAALGFVVGQCLLCGCQGTSATTTPADQATALEQTRCTGDIDEAAVARVLDGSTVERVDPAYNGSASKGGNPRLHGAAILVRPSRGETAEWLARALECHGAQQLHAYATGAAAKADPFWLPESVVQIAVASSRDEFRIEVTSDSSDQAREILARAQALPHAHSPTAALESR